MEIPPTRVLLVRHGAAEGVDGIAVGQVDLPLSEPGAASIRKLVAGWRGPRPDRLVTSDLERTAASARILAEAWSIELVHEPRLREIDYGAWDGEPWREIKKRDGERLESWMRRWWHDPAPGGESLADVACRANAWLDEVLEQPPGETVLAVAHGGSIRSMICRALGLELRRAYHFRLDHGLLSGLVTSQRGIEVAFLNVDRHPVDP